ncbi:Fibronectin type-III domain-containing protein [Balamuthia mandrillaris]
MPHQHRSPLLAAAACGGRGRTWRTVDAAFVAFGFLLTLLILGVARPTAAAGAAKEAIPTNFIDRDLAISHPTLLLPHITASTKVSFTLEAYNGCFKWTSRNPEIASVRPIYSDEAPSSSLSSPDNTHKHSDDRERGCSSRALVVSESSAATERLSTWLQAEDVLSGRVLRCEVFTDRITNIELLTTTRSMYRDDIEMLSIQAFDNDGNLFSTVEGLTFQWSIIPETFAQASSVLKLIPFKEAGVEVSSVVLRMEEMGETTGVVLIQGVDTGKANVVARLSEPEYADLASASVGLAVLEPLVISPAIPIYITTGTEVQYTLSTFHRDGTRRINMPNPKYNWATSNTDVASVNQVGLVRGLRPGMTRVTVDYVDMANNEAKAVVNVVEPAYLALKVVSESSLSGETGPSSSGVSGPSSNWYLVKGMNYHLDIEVYDKDAHKLYNIDNLNFETLIPNQYFKVTDASKNMAHHAITPFETADTEIIATLTEIPDASGYLTRLPQGISVTQGVIITEPVRIVTASKTLLLPWDPTIRHSYQLNVTGGSGIYNWYSADTSTVSVSAAGIVTVQKEGKATIMAVDKKNPQNRDQIDVIALPAAQVGFLPETTVEVQVGHPLLLPVVLQDHSSRRFDNCSALPFQWEISDTSVFSLQDTAAELDPNVKGNLKLEGSCAVKSFFALKEGHATVTLRYGRFSKEITLFAFSPLKVLSPEDTALVTLGSTATITFEGGPNPWLYEPTAFFAEVKPSNPSTVKVKKAKMESVHSRARHSFLLTCLQHGDQTIEIVVGNRPTATNPHPAQMSATTAFSCKPPHTLLLYPAEPQHKGVGDEQLCAESMKYPSLEMMTKETSHLPTTHQTRNSRSIPFNVSILDDQRRYFDDFSSLHILWETEHPELAEFVPVTSEAQAESRSIKHKRVLKTHTGTGTTFVKVSAVSYDPAFLIDTIGSAPRLDTSGPLTRTFDLQLVNNVQLSPPVASVYNDPRNAVRLTTSFGSGVYRYLTNSSRLCDLRPSNDLSYVDVVPRRPGVIKVSVEDICLAGSEPATAIIRISEIGTIHLKTADLIPVGKTTELKVEVLDRDGFPFEPSQYGMMKFNVHVDNEAVLSVEDLHGNERQGQQDALSGRYVLRGIALGIARLTVTAQTSSGEVISSNPVAIHVFPPLRLKPSNRLVLLPGGRFQVQWIGGPPVRADVTFQVDNNTVCNVNTNGYVTATNVGTTILTATVRGERNLCDNEEQAREENNCEGVIYGQDTIEVVVRHISSLRIHSGSNRLLAGSEMTVRVAGPEGETPFTLGQAGIDFQWHSLDSTVALLLPVYHEAGVSLDQEQSFSVRVVGKAAGTTRISVAAHSGDNSHPSISSWTSSMQVTVEEGLKLLSDSSLLLPPASYAVIRTNKDGLGRLRYSILRGACKEEERLLSKQGLLTTTTNLIAECTGNVESGEEEASSFLRVDSQAQSLVIKVVVKPVHHLQLLPLPPVYQDLPLGAKMEFRIVLRDELGAAFSVCSGPSFQTELNVIDVVSVSQGSSNYTLAVRALRPGEAILRAYTSQTALMDDYVKVRVGHAIIPPSPMVHLGGSVHFTTSLQEDRTTPFPMDVWSVDNPRVLSIHPRSGEAQAKQPGVALVYHNSTINTYTVVKVKQVDHVHVEVNSPFISNVVEGSLGEGDYRFKVKFYDDDGQLFAPHGSLPFSSSSSVDHNISLRCAIEESSEWASAEAFFDTETGEHYCLIRTRTPENKKLRMPEQVQLVVSVSDAAHSYSLEHREPLKYSPAFVIPDEYKFVELSPNRQTRVIELRSTAPLFVTSSDPSRVALKKHSTDPHNERVWYEVQVLKTSEPFRSVILEFLNPVTTQKEEVVVSFGFDLQLVPIPGAPASACSASAPQSNLSYEPRRTDTYSALSWALMGVIGVVTVIFAYVLMTKNQKPQLHQAMPYPTSPQPGATPAFHHDARTFFFFLQLFLLAIFLTF